VFVAHVSVTKAAAPAVVEPGGNVTWNIQVINDGGTDLRGVAVSDATCPGTVSSPSGPGTATGVLARGATWTYTCTEAMTQVKTDTANVQAVPFQNLNGVEIVGPPSPARPTQSSTSCRPTPGSRS
jgi:uncharacterized repeat protein (TIGR01451 family)